MQIKALHQYDCLRANKSTFAWGLEARVPFLDKAFINTAMSIDPESKMVCVKNMIWLVFITLKILRHLFSWFTNLMLR